MRKIIFVLFGVVLLSGCVSNPVNQLTSTLGIDSAEAYRVSLPYSMNGSSYEINDSIKSYINKRKPASSRFIREARKIKFVDDWLDKDSDKSKAMFAIDPQSCKDSYRHSSWNFRTDLAAIDRAKKRV